MIVIGAICLKFVYDRALWSVNAAPIALIALALLVHVRCCSEGAVWDNIFVDCLS